MLGDDLLGRRRASPEIKRRSARPRGAGEDEAVLHLVVRPLVVHPGILIRPEGAHDVQKLVRPLVARIMPRPVPVAARIHRGAAGHDVHRQPPARDEIERVRLLHGESRRGEAGPDGDAEFDAVRFAGDRGGQEPAVRTRGVARNEHVRQAARLRRFRDVDEIVDLGRYLHLTRAEAGGVAPLVRGQIPGVFDGFLAIHFVCVPQLLVSYNEIIERFIFRRSSLRKKPPRPQGGCWKSTIDGKTP